METIIVTKVSSNTLSVTVHVAKDMADAIRHATAMHDAVQRPDIDYPKVTDEERDALHELLMEHKYVRVICAGITTVIQIHRIPHAVESNL